MGEPKIIHGDCLTVLKTLSDGSVNTCVTSPPYWGLRDYGVDGQIGLESTPEEYVARMVEVFREVKRVLRDDGTLWLNLGDSYMGGGGGNYGDGLSVQAHKTHPTAGKDKPKTAKGYKSKDLVGIPWMVAFALRADGWYLRQDIIWHKPNPMPESVTDRCTKAHEYIFLMSKSAKYYFDNEAIMEMSIHAGKIVKNNAGKNSQMGKYGATREGFLKDEGVLVTDNRNKRSVWTVTTKPYSGAHFATFPEDLITPCILAGCQQGGVVLDPFFGAGTTGVVAKKNQRDFIGIELNTEYIKIAEKRIINTDGVML